MKVKDAHVHIDIQDKQKIIEYFNSEEVEAINIILNSDEEKNAFLQLSDILLITKKELKLTVTDDYRKETNNFMEQLKEKGFLGVGLKIHPRFEQYTLADIPGIMNNIREKGYPYVIVDAFYYGHELQYQIAKELILELAMQFPEKHIIAAHAGGYRVLEYMLTFRDLGNVYYDISYMNYFKYSSVIGDYRQLIMYNSNKVLFGTDLPYFNMDETQTLFWKLVNDMPENKKLAQNILYCNFDKILC